MVFARVFSVHKQGCSPMLEWQFFFGGREWKMTDITCGLLVKCKG